MYQMTSLQLLYKNIHLSQHEGFLNLNSSVTVILMSSVKNALVVIVFQDAQHRSYSNKESVGCFQIKAFYFCHFLFCVFPPQHPPSSPLQIT